MKYWQLSACLAEEKNIHNKYLGEIDLLKQGIDDISDEIVKQSFSESKVKYIITTDNILRLELDEYSKSLGLRIKETISILEAFNRYGGNAVTEVFDYGSFDLSQIENGEM